MEGFSAAGWAKGLEWVFEPVNQLETEDIGRKEGASLLRKSACRHTAHAVQGHNLLASDGAYILNHVEEVCFLA